MIVFGLGKNLLSKSVLGHCDPHSDGPYKVGSKCLTAYTNTRGLKVPRCTSNSINGNSDQRDSKSRPKSCENGVFISKATQS